MRPLYKYEMPTDEAEIRDFLAKNWSEAVAQGDGRTTLKLVGDEQHAQVAEWLVSLSAYDAYRVSRVFKIRRSKLPSSFPAEWQPLFAIWRNAQFALEAIERGESAAVTGQEEAAAALDWTTLATPEELARIFQQSGGRQDA